MNQWLRSTKTIKGKLGFHSEKRSAMGHLATETSCLLWQRRSPVSKNCCAEDCRQALLRFLKHREWENFFNGKESIVLFEIGPSLRKRAQSKKRRLGTSGIVALFYSSLSFRPCTALAKPSKGRHFVWFQNDYHCTVLCVCARLQSPTEPLLLFFRNRSASCHYFGYLGFLLSNHILSFLICWTGFAGIRSWSTGYFAKK